MKKLLFLSLLFPMLAIGQNDSIKILQILEKSSKAMDLHCYSLEYKINHTTSTFGLNTELYYSKIIFDTNFNIQKLWVETLNNKKTSQSNNKSIDFSDKVKDTSFMWSERSSLLTVGSANLLLNNGNGLLRSFNNNYFKDTKELIEYIQTPIETPIDTVFYEGDFSFKTDSSLKLKDLVVLNGRPNFVVEKIYNIHENWYWSYHRYPDDSSDFYRTILWYQYLYIDTSSFIVNKLCSFIITSTFDTVLFKETNLLDYNLNSVKDISFHPNNYNIARILKGNNDNPCSKENVIQSLRGKAPNITGIDTAGQNFSLYAQKAKCYVLDFIYSGCSICISTGLPYLKELRNKYNTPDISYILVNPIDNMDKIKMFVKKYGIDICMIQDHEAIKNYGILAYPTCFILDENFNTLFEGIGLSECDKREIEKILSKYHN